MRLHSLDLRNIVIEDSFWSKHVDLVRREIIPYQWEAMNDRIEDAEPSHCLENFKIAAGRSTGDFYGEVFQDTDVAKWLEAVGYSLACYPDEELEQTADEVIDLIAEAQGEDGYLDTYFTIHDPAGRWQHLAEGHELYTAGHMMEAAVAYYEGTGKRKLLDCVCRLADLIAETFGTEEGKVHGYPGHEEVEIGLIRLSQATGEKKYLDLAKYFIDIRGVGENYFVNEMKRPGHHVIYADFQNYQPAYSQSHLPVREQTTAEGHAVRAVYLYSAMADLADAYQDAGLKKACETLWENIVTKRMYLTGGIGSSGILERFTTDYDLPNEYNYSESCASVGLAMFGMRMNQITRESRYVDVVERALYNTVLGGIALDGKSFFYVNPLEVWPDACMDRTSKQHVKPVRQKWFGCACCPPNIARTLASLGQYIYAVDAENRALYVNLFVSNETEVSFGEEERVHVSMETHFPWDNTIQICVTDVPENGMTLHIRIPDYAQNYSVSGNGMVTGAPEENGYWTVKTDEACELQITFEAPAHYVYANPQVRADAGKAAIVRGPLVYCLEECDNGANLPAIMADTEEPLAEVASDLFGGSVIVTGHGKKVKENSWKEGLYGVQKPETEEVSFTAIPYPYWNNRGEGEMLVWIRDGRI
ncbi:MAG: glycoside hydrolase family 127 protein [Clostridiales bacterium]|nr:glycoside hydrolase family 127 protein [Clostridiales bacterium]